MCIGFLGWVYLINIVYLLTYLFEGGGFGVKIVDIVQITLFINTAGLNKKMQSFEQYI